MKYAFIIVLITVITSLFSTIYAAEDRQPKTISGKVRNPDLTVAKNVLVSITCKNNTLTDETSVNGNYSVTFGVGECEQFDTVFIEIQTETLYGSASKVVTYALTTSMSDIFLAEQIINPTPTGEVPVSVPEFGFVSAIMAGSVSLLAYKRLRQNI